MPSMSLISGWVPAREMDSFSTVVYWSMYSLEYFTSIFTYFDSSSIATFRASRSSRALSPQMPWVRISSL